mmetsp:Transcript_14590/g.16831  ORF Transcript_14590/g.16831 Transcript_14590/m.16831 type:complete len:101 (-) Transcript_14590:640-942(-)
MSSRRRANNKTRRSRQTGPRSLDLDDLDGSLSTLIGKEVEAAVPTEEERRFTMHSSNEHKGTGLHFADDHTDTFDPCTASNTGNFEKHQANFSATKYIKP